MPGLLKIGKTTRSVEARAIEIDTTGVPEPFIVVHEVISPNCHELETIVHQELDSFRVRQGREFFRIPSSDAIDTIDRLLLEQVSEWLEEFLPCHTLVNETHFIEPADIEKLAMNVGTGSGAICEAFYLIEPDEIRPSLMRLGEKRAKRSQTQRSSNERLQ
jgi:hypothetical protein